MLIIAYSFGFFNFFVVFIFIFVESLAMLVKACSNVLFIKKKPGFWKQSLLYLFSLSGRTLWFNLYAL